MKFFLLTTKHSNFFSTMTMLRCATYWVLVEQNISKVVYIFEVVFILFVITVQCTYIPVGLFYFTLGNLHPKYQSKLRNII